MCGRKKSVGMVLETLERLLFHGLSGPVTEFAVTGRKVAQKAARLIGVICGEKFRWERSSK
jgi:hypothetical protein